MSHAEKVKEALSLLGSVILLLLVFKGILTTTFVQLKWEGECFIIGQPQDVAVGWTQTMS